MNTANRTLPAMPRPPRLHINHVLLMPAFRVIKLLYLLSCFALPCLVLLIALQYVFPLWLTFLLVVAAVLLACLAITLLFKVLNHLPPSFVRVDGRIFFLYTDGFLMMSEDTSRCHIVHWNELAEFRISRIVRYNVRLLNGLLVKIDTQGRQTRALTDRIEHEIAQRYAPAALTSYHQGHVLDFGRVRVSTQGMEIDDGFQQSSWHTLAWSDIAQIRLVFPSPFSTPVNTFLVCCKNRHHQGHQHRYLLDLKDIPNLSVLQEILKIQHCPYRYHSILF
jgi:hypothetical protein